MFCSIGLSLRLGDERLLLLENGFGSGKQSMTSMISQIYTASRHIPNFDQRDQKKSG